MASLLAAAMTLTMAPAAFAAEGETAGLSKSPTSSITTTNEDSNTLQYKINHDTAGKKIVLDKDYTESVKIENGEHTIDLNGHKITNKTGENTITVAKGATLTIVGKGTVDNVVSNAKAAIWNNGTCTLNGGMFTGGIYTINNDCDAILTINGGTFTNDTQAVFQNHGTATVTGGTFVGTLINIYGLNSDVSIVNISGGNFKGGIQKNNGKISISGGNFNFDPTDFCAEGKIGVPSDNKDYPYTVADGVNNVKVAPPAAPTAKADTGKYAEDSDEAIKMAAAAESIAKDGKTKITGLADVASTEATKITPDDVTKATEELKNAGVNLSGNKKVSLYVQPYLDITVSDIDLFADNMNAPIALTLNIVPKVKKIASTATNAADIKTDEGNGKNAVQVGETPVEVNTPVTITIPMPNDFPAQDGDKIVVKHEKNGQFICYHRATYNATDKTVTFTNDKGFSTFTIKFDNRSAKILFTDKDGKNIGEQTEYDAIRVNETLPTTEAPSGYKFTGWSFKSNDETISGTYTVMTEELLTKLDNRYKVYTATPVFASTSSSSGGSSSGGSSSKTTYKVTTSSVANGGVNVTPSSPAKGDKVKITLSPNKGYKLDKLTVTDASGKTVSATKTSDTVYTFTMPASQVTVGVTYVKADETTEQPSTKTFSDVSSSDWFADAVKYVSDKGMMNGTGTGKFSPADSTTRAMLMTVIARYAGADTTGSNPWYQKSMEWAKANGVSDGTAPNANITREQLVTMLYRYAKSTGKDVSVGKDTNILSYTDATTVSEYAVPAMQWACGAGIVNGANGKLNPQNNATRAEVAAILMRYCENIK